MYRMGQVELVFVNQTNDDDGNPIINEERETVKCTLTNAFSQNYYQNQNRDMRRARNIKVAKFNVADRMIDGKRYQLESAYLNGFRYKISNILIDRTSSLMAILDMDEVMSE